MIKIPILYIMLYGIHYDVCLMMIVSMYDSLCLASAGLSFEDEMSCDTVLELLGAKCFSCTDPPKWNESAATFEKEHNEEH